MTRRIPPGLIGAVLVATGLSAVPFRVDVAGPLFKDEAKSSGLAFTRMLPDIVNSCEPGKRFAEMFVAPDALVVA